MKTIIHRMLGILLAATLVFGLPVSPSGNVLSCSAAYAAAASADVQETAQNVNKVKTYADQLKNANSVNRTTGKFTWDTESKTRSWTYYNGLMMDAYNMYGYYSYVEGFYNANISSDGTISNFSTGQLDSVEPIRAVFDLLGGNGYTSSNAVKYKKGITKVYQMLEDQITFSQAGGNYAHKQDNTTTLSSSWSSYPIALDGIYMAQPFLMECANAIDAGRLTLTNKSNQTVTSESIYNAVYSRLVWIYENLYNESTHLYDHAATASGSTNGISWSRSIGWYSMALVDTIEMMPAGSRRDNLIAELPRIFDGLLEYQDEETGMWYNVTAYDSSLSGNILETSGSIQFAYSMMKAYNNGYVTDTRYAEAGLRAFNGVINNKMTVSGGTYSVKDTYISSGANTTPSAYLTKSYVTNEAKGVGALLMAATLANTTASLLEAATARQCTGITVTPPAKRTYLSGESLDLSGMIVIANYNQGASEEVTDYTVSELPAAAGSHIITVTYEGFSYEFYVEVHKASSEWTQLTASTCTAPGQRVRFCEACDLIMEEENLPLLDHDVVTDPAVEATCSSTGLTEGSHCSICGTVFTAQVEIPALAHVPVIDEGVEISCTTDGLTEGSHCSVCGEVLTPQEVIRAAGHTVVTVPGRAPTCTETGCTEGRSCSVCGEVIAVSEEIPALGHTVVTEPGLAPTCTEYGLTDESWCTVCGEVFSELDLIRPTGHTVVVVPSVTATCTEPGLTAGTYCSVCEKVLQQQYTIAASGHVEKVTRGYSASCTTDGLTDSGVCYYCGITMREAEVIPAAGHTPVIDPEIEPEGCTGTGLTEGSHCGVCGLFLTARETIPAKGHTSVRDDGTDATCTTSGMTAGTHCSVCGEVVIPQIVIPALGHSVFIDKAVPATCTADGLTEGSHCYLCGEVYAEQEVVPATGHTVVIDEAIPATCAAIGYTEGSHCATCGTVIDRQMVVDKTAHSYTFISAQMPTLTKAGRTFGIVCGNCGYERIASTTIPPLSQWFR